MPALRNRMIPFVGINEAQLHAQEPQQQKQKQGKGFGKGVNHNKKNTTSGGGGGKEAVFWCYQNGTQKR